MIAEKTVVGSAPFLNFFIKFAPLPENRKFLSKYFKIKQL